MENDKKLYREYFKQVYSLLNLKRYYKLVADKTKKSEDINKYNIICNSIDKLSNNFDIIIKNSNDEIEKLKTRTIPKMISVYPDLKDTYNMYLLDDKYEGKEFNNLVNDFNLKATNEIKDLTEKINNDGLSDLKNNIGIFKLLKEYKTLGVDFHYFSDLSFNILNMCLLKTIIKEDKILESNSYFNNVKKEEIPKIIKLDDDYFSVNIKFLDDFNYCLAKQKAVYVLRLSDENNELKNNNDLLLKDSTNKSLKLKNEKLKNNIKYNELFVEIVNELQDFIRIVKLANIGIDNIRYNIKDKNGDLNFALKKYQNNQGNNNSFDLNKLINDLKNDLGEEDLFDVDFKDVDYKDRDFVILSKLQLNDIIFKTKFIEGAIEPNIEILKALNQKMEYSDKEVWFSAYLIGTIFETNVSKINESISNIARDNGVSEEEVESMYTREEIKNFGINSNDLADTLRFENGNKHYIFDGYTINGVEDNSTFEISSKKDAFKFFGFDVAKIFDKDGNASDDIM